MKNDATTKLMSKILFICLIISFIGQIFKIQHYPHGNLITFFGFGSYLIISLIEMDRLKKRISKLTKDNQEFE